MSLLSSYLVTTKNLESFFNSLLTAQAPSTFTQKFLESLEFKSSNDRLYIGLLKGLGFLDQNAAPTRRYYRFLDQSQSKHVLAEAIREAYSDLFAVNVNANELSISAVRNKLKTLTQGKNSPNVIHLMANTFKALVGYADWSVPKKLEDEQQVTPVPASTETSCVEQQVRGVETVEPPEDVSLRGIELHYNIQIHLPESRDTAVYDALFKSLRKHLM